MFKKVAFSERIGSFKEVVIGFSKEEAINEAKRCLRCKNPGCVELCPLGVDVPKFIAELAKGNIEGAYEILIEKNNLPAICGRVCPQEKFCEFGCHLKDKKINIGLLERFVGEWALDARKGKKRKRNKGKVAIVGSGPAGLNCACELLKYGVKVKIYESLHKIGGVLRYGIPEFRLPKYILEKEIQKLNIMGCDMVTNTLIGRTYTLDELRKENAAVFVATGAGIPSFLGIGGEGLCGVYSANEFLTRVNLMHAYEFPKYHTPINIGKSLIVIGGGNTAIDVARCAKRLGAQVEVMYRRTREEMPAREVEIKNAIEEGIEFNFLVLPKKIVGRDGTVKAIICLKCKISDELDKSGRRKYEIIEGSEFSIPCDTVVIAVGFKPNTLLARLTPELKTDSKGYIIVDEDMETTIKGVYAGGDVVGAESVVESLNTSNKAAKSILKFLGIL